MSSPKAPTPPSPGASATAAAGSAEGGQMFDVANAPIEGYANAVTEAAINPYTTALQTALNNQSAMQQAQGSKAIQAMVNPQAFAIQQMGLSNSQRQLGSLYGYNPDSIGYSSPTAFQLPSTSSLPSLGTLGTISQDIAKQLSTIKYNKDAVPTGIQGPIGGVAPDLSGLLAQFPQLQYG